MERLPRTLLLFLVLYLGLVIYANRSLLFSRFDAIYWKDKYEHSQWKLPLSTRTIGDDGLYLYEGYRLIRGGDPTLLNAEVPPLGKYLIGTHILALGNGYLYGLTTTILLLAAACFLTKRLTNNITLSLAVTVLLATDPMITNQYALTMLDSLQSLWLLLYILALFLMRTASKQHIMRSMIAGIALGLFSETKAPLLAPLLTLCGIYYLLVTTKKLRNVLGFLVGIAIGYLIPYVPYFASGHSLMEWMKVQKWIVSFYRHSNLTPTWGSALTSLFTGMYQNIFSRAWTRASEWSPVWGIMTIASASLLFAGRSPLTHRTLRFSAGILLLITGFYSVIPFWTRYLITILPLLYIIGAIMLSRLFPKRHPAIWAILLLLNIACSLPILFPSARNAANQFIYQTERGFFTDLYEDTTAHYRTTVNREAFRRFGLQTLADGEIEHMEIKPVSGLPEGYASPQYLRATVTYYTRRLGSFTRPVTVPFVRERNRWHIPWEWSFLLPGITDTTRLYTTVVPAHRGSILASDKKPLAEDAPGFLISVVPDRTDKTKESELLSLLETLLGGYIPQVAIHQRLFGNTASGIAIPVGVVPYPKTDPNMQRITRLPGVILTDTFTRVLHPNNVVQLGELKNTAYSECCSMLYDTTNYDGISGVEHAKNDLLKGTNGGTLTLTDTQGTILQTYISRAKHDGQDVQP